MPKSRRPFSLTRFIFSAQGLILGILLAALVTAVVAQTQGVRLFSQAASRNTNLAVFPDIDPQTKEFYDLTIDSSLRVASVSGGAYVAQSDLRLAGSRVENLPTVYAVKQTSESPYPQAYEFSRESVNGKVYFRVARLETVYNGCLDLYSSTVPAREKYVATLCYKNTYVVPNALRNNPVVIYSPAANPFISSQFTGTRPSGVQIWSMAFNKYQVKPAGSENGPYMTRVNYLAVDANSDPNWYKNSKFTFQGLTRGLTAAQQEAFCYSSVSNPQKYMQVRLDPHPGGQPTMLQKLTEFSNCTGSIVLQNMMMGYISLWQEGGVPVPLDLATEIPIPVSPKPVPTKSPTPIKVTPSAVPIPKLPIK